MQTQTVHQVQIEPADDTLPVSAVILWVVFAGMALDALARWLT